MWTGVRAGIGGMVVMAAWGVIAGAMAARAESPVVAAPGAPLRMGGAAVSKKVVRSPRMGNLNGCQLLQHGALLARFGGALNGEEGQYTGRSYLDICAAQGFAPTMVCETEEEAGSFPVFKAAFAEDGHRAVFCELDWQHQGHSVLNVADLHEDAEGSVRELKRTEGWVMVMGITRDGHTAATQTTTSDAVELWDLESGKERARLEVGMNVGVLAFDSTGSRLIVGAGRSGQSHVEIWDTATGKRLTVGEGHTGSVVAAAVGPGDETVATADSDGAVWLWALATGKALARVECGRETIRSVAFSADGRRLLAAADREPEAKDGAGNRRVRLHVWDVASARELVRYESVGRQIDSAVFDASGREVVTYGVGEVKRWLIPQDLPASLERDPAAAPLMPTDGEMWSIDYRGGWAVAFGGDGKQVIAGGVDAVASWDAASGAAGFTSKQPGLVRTLDAALDMGVREQTRDHRGYAEVVRLSSDKTMATIDPGDFPYIDAVALSPDGKTVALAGGCMKERVAPVFTPRLELFHASDGSSLVAVTEHIDAVRCLAFSPDSKRLYVASGWRKEDLHDCTVRALNAASGREEAAFVGFTEVPVAMALSRAGDRLWVVGEGGTVRCVRTADGSVVAVTPSVGQAYSLAVSGDGRLVAVGLAVNNIVLIRAETGEVVGGLRHHHGVVMGVGFSPDGRRLASVSTDRTVRLWDVGAVLAKR